MKKILKPNILILGSSRSGKTTLGNKICKKYKYNLISLDNLVSAFQKGLPELNISHDDRSGISVKKITPFVIQYIKSLTSYVQQIKNINYVIEGCYFDLDELKSIFDSKLIIIVITRNLLSNKDLFDELKEHDEEWDWTSKLSDSELLNYCDNLVSNNQYIKEFCESNDIKYIDVSLDRNRKLKKILYDVGSEIKEKSKIVELN